MQDNRPIGIFDSGVGGLTVAQAIADLLPGENLIYFGDTLHFPYGDKTPETLVRYGMEIASFLLDFDIKILVIACNTASAYCLRELSHKLTIPVLGVIQPGVKKALEASPEGRIAILGTRGTIRSHSYQKAILSLKPHAEICPIECPLLAPLVEENFIHHPATQLIVKTYLEVLKQKPTDCLLLGCTHFPLLKPIFIEAVGREISIVDSASSLAEELALLLKSMDLANRHHEGGTMTYFVSEDPQKFQKIGRLFLNKPITEVLEAAQVIRLSNQILSPNQIYSN